MASFDKSVLPRVKGAKVDMFYGGQQATVISATGWVQWIKPKNATLFQMICIGGGAGGGGGASSGTGVAAGGGGGGGTGAISTLIIPSFFLPDTLFLLPGCGGNGGPAATIGVSGQRSVIADRVNTLGTAANTILVSGSTPTSGGGAAGTSGGSNIGGLAETAPSAINGRYQGMGTYQSFTGQAGVAGGTNAGSGGVSVAWGTGGISLTGGAGGGSCSTTTTRGAGGNITGAGAVPTLAGGTSPAGAGANGIAQGWYFLGGAGGAAQNNGTAGIGGNGAPGCGGGGGGGGGGTGGGTGGAGGAGGPGLIIIVSW